ncbi:MAG: hypothetical protein R8M11_07130, partial [Gallionella sp.]
HRAIAGLQYGNTIHRLYHLKNGDYFIEYAKDYFPAEEKFVYGGINFFSGVVSEEDAINYLRGTLNYTGMGELEIELPNKTRIALKNLDPRLPKRCPQTLNYYYLLEHPDGRIEKKSLLYLLDKPTIENIKPRCASTIETSVSNSVVSLKGGFIPLDDGGVLFTDTYEGLVICFDEKFRTKSDLLGKKLFIVNTTELQSMGINKFEMINYQRNQDKTFEFIESLKKIGGE